MVEDGNISVSREEVALMFYNHSKNPGKFTKGAQLKLKV